MNQDKATDSNPPGWVYALIFLGGSLTLIPWLHFWKRPFPRALVVFHATVPWLLPWVLPINWLFMAFFWLIWNGLFGLLFVTLKPPQRIKSDRLSHPFWLRRGFGAALVILPLGCMLVALEQWVTDGLWSSYYPVNASLDSISFEVLALWQNFALLLLFSGIHAARRGETFTPTRLATLLLFSFGGYFIATQAFMALMAIPSWQLTERQVFPPLVENGRQILYHLLTFVALPLLTTSAYRNVLLGTPVWRPWLRGLASLVLALVGLSFATGMPIYYSLLMGMQYEKEARPERAIPWYGRALTWSRSDKLNSYLQFHMGLLWRKQGKLNLAHEAFLRVLVRYPQDNDLLVMAHEFQGRLELPGIQDSVRKVIPGIEARTEYKNAYCVPNSLGLVLNYWGDKTGAKAIGAEITQLDQGSFITDAVHFSEKRGFKTIVLAKRDLRDLFQLIDHGFPILTFIPGHVLAVFGYDRALQTLVTYDVNTVDIWDDQPWTAFQRDWGEQFNTLAVVCPAAKLTELQQILGPKMQSESEAYIQYLLAGLEVDNPDTQARYLQKTAGHQLFFATWQREELIGKSFYNKTEDSAASHFLLRNHLPETEQLSYVRSLYSHGHCLEALKFLKSYSQENVLTQAMYLVRAGCLAKTGQVDSAANVLNDEGDTKTMASTLIGFLLSQKKIMDDPVLGKSIATDALEQSEGLDGETAGKALVSYLQEQDYDPREIEASLDVLEGYVTRHNPYDTFALAEIERLGPLKRFRSDQDLERESFQKRLGLYRDRRISLIR